MSKMQKISVETPGIQSIDTIKVPSILICVDICRNTTGEVDGPAGSPAAEV